ncbi:MAG: YCF48-related protein [Bacteroidia bacterium]|jgi:photosystem II stability/assembly factor-like uncharacterized protein
MNKLIILILVSLPSWCNAQWNGIYFHSDEENKIAVINKDTLITITAWNGRIHRSTDGGQSWSFYQTPFLTSWFLDVHFPTQSIGYACGGTAFGTHTNVIVKTTDAGLTWDSVTSNAYDGFSFHKIHFLNADTGFVAQEAGNMLYTVDGGLNFSVRPTPGTIFDMVSKPDKTLFFSIKTKLNSTTEIYSIVRSTDLGSTWSAVYADTFANADGINNRIINSLQFVNNTIGYACGGNGVFLKTTDGGASWSKSLIHPYTNLQSLHFPSPNRGYMNIAGGIYTTVDGGTTWTVQAVNPMTIIRHIQMSNDSVGFALGSQGVYKTTNGGMTTGLNERSNDIPFLLYPNPAHDVLYMEWKNEPPLKTLELIDLSGKNILTMQSADESWQLNLSSVREGMYFIRVSSNGTTITRKVIKE